MCGLHLFCGRSISDEEKAVAHSWPADSPNINHAYLTHAHHVHMCASENILCVKMLCVCVF